MKGSSPQHGNAIVEAKIAHQRIDPLRRIGCPGYPIFRPQDQIETPAGAHEPLFLRQPVGGGSECLRTQA